MYWLITALALAQEPIFIDKTHKEIYVAPPTINDPSLNKIQDYITSLVVSSAGTNSHWVRRQGHGETISIYDKYTVGLKKDTVCNYDEPLVCGAENYHWVLITDISVTDNFAVIILKLYDENTQLIASTSKASYSVERCAQPVKTTIIQKGSQPPTEITEVLPEKCKSFKPVILDKDIKSAVTILFASIHPKR
tara:strand:- start:957 stop:1535 length:579 start_codon:yes stop_codon:yes gene_type:complete